MSDPFLRGHRHSPNLYSLAGRTPLSIRDQIIRAHYLVERLLSTQVLKPGSTLLVVGAGAAGASVATIAARRGVDVTVVDTNGSPFSLQRLCTTRWVDPVQYDWPLSHSSAGVWPATGPNPAVPFGFRAEIASVIAGWWANTLNIERLRPNLIVEFRTKLEKLPRRSATVPGKLDAVTERLRQPAQTRQFDVAVLAVGMASERTEVPFHAPSVKGAPHFHGIPFWAPDNFEKPSFGLVPSPKDVVLVSGGGDGALQDYIRLMTGNRSALELLQKLSAAAGWKPWRLRLELLFLQEAEHWAERSLPWNETETQDHAVLSRLHQSHQAMVRHWVSMTTDWASMGATLRKETAGRSVDKVVLIHSCDHFPGCFALNRFVALLIEQFVRDEHGHGSIAAGRRLKAARPLAVAGRAHACGPRCWGPQHEVEVESAPSCYSPAALSVPQRFPVSGLVVRHGIKKHTRAQWLRHLLPQDLP